MANRILLLVLALSIAGCTSLQRYGSARTLPEGELAFAAAIDLVHGYEPQLGETMPGDEIWPVAPRIGVRYGLAAGSEIGVEYGGLTGTVDWKQELFRSAIVDVAIDPAVTGGFSGAAEAEVVVAQLPLLVGLHATDWLTVVPQASFGWGWRAGESFSTQTVLAGGGLGLYVRVAEWLALQPLAGVTWELDSGYRYLSGGLGVLVGGQPARGIQ